MSDYGYIAQIDIPGGLVKVGRSSAPERRIAQLAQANPYPLRTICFLVNGARIEKELKARLSRQREAMLAVDPEMHGEEAEALRRAIAALSRSARFDALISTPSDKDGGL